MICGVADGYQTGGASISREIAKTRPDVVIVALGNPLQELWMAEHGAKTGARLVFGVGALFDFLSGEVPRAPQLVRNLRLEWLYRTFLEPGRLLKRYTWEMLVFFWRVRRRHRSASAVNAPLRGVAAPESAER